MTKPQAPKAMHEAPAVGPSVVFTVTFTVEGVTHVKHSSALLGPGRDYADRADAVSAEFHTDNASAVVSEQFETMSAMVAAFPDVAMDGTAKRLYAVELAREDYRVALALWEAALEADGLEPCDRCGGEGGWKGWPGFTCYECNGAGTQPREGAPEKREYACDRCDKGASFYPDEKLTLGAGCECGGAWIDLAAFEGGRV